LIVRPGPRQHYEKRVPIVERLLRESDCPIGFADNCVPIKGRAHDQSSAVRPTELQELVRLDTITLGAAFHLECGGWAPLFLLKPDFVFVNRVASYTKAAIPTSRDRTPKLRLILPFRNPSRRPGSARGLHLLFQFSQIGLDQLM